MEHLLKANRLSFKAVAVAWVQGLWWPQEWTALPGSARDKAGLLVFYLPHISF